MDQIQEVDIDEGRFKYILIKVTKGDESKFIVRGYKWAGYHDDIFQVVAANSADIKYECVGGGRIEHNFKEKKIFVYGYSQGYGKANHALACSLIEKKYPDYSVTWSDEGY